jgi:16S rRNA (guanine527-N7)-methyltransferase
MLDSFFTPGQIGLIDQSFELLSTWNHRHNLTRITEKTSFIERHVLDSAVTRKHLIPLFPKSAIDLGTGAGIPGVILAILMPDTHWHLVDANAKRIAFLEHVKFHLNLNISPHHQRIENFQQHVDLIITRAVSDPETILKITQHLWHEDLHIHLMRSSNWEALLSNEKWQYQEISLNIPKSDLTRYLMILTQKTGKKPIF